MTEPLSFQIPAQVLDAVASRAADIVLERLQAEPNTSEVTSPYLTIREAAVLLRCSRQRIDDLLSQRRLTRHKDGSRTLVLRAEIQEHLRHEERRA